MIENFEEMLFYFSKHSIYYLYYYQFMSNIFIDFLSYFFNLIIQSQIFEHFKKLYLNRFDKDFHYEICSLF